MIVRSDRVIKYFGFKKNDLKSCLMKSCFDGEKKTTYIVKDITNIFALVEGVIILKPVNLLRSLMFIFVFCKIK